MFLPSESHSAPIPARSEPGKTWVPLPMQRAALECGAYELFLGGAAGPGKSEYLVVAPLRWIGHPSFKAVLFRNTFPELQRTLIEKSRRLYPSLGGVFNEARHAWTFPSRATIEYAYLERDADVHRYQGAEFSFAGFDELPHFTEYQYRYIMSRLRNAAGLPIRLRATGNPDGPHLEWVRKRFALWIDKQAPSGEVRWFEPEGAEVPKGTEHSLSRSYIPGRLKDNPFLGPEYEAQLRALDPVTRAKLLDGDWDACVGEGALFHRTWWRMLDYPPTKYLRRVRAWDLAATANGDWTRGVRMLDLGPDHGAQPRFVIDDVVSLRGAPHDVRALVKSTAEIDGRQTIIAIPQDPGQAGVEQSRSYTTDLAGFIVHTRRPTGDKVVRASPLSSQVGARNVGLVRGQWNTALIAEAHAFPAKGTPDDQIDAASDAFAELAVPQGIPAKTTMIHTVNNRSW